MRVLVTGASGFVGQEVLRQLHTAQHQVRILARDPHAPALRKATARYGADVHAGDILRRDTLEGAMAGVDAVIHLVGIIREVGDNTFENVHTGGTLNLVAAIQAAHVRRFIHMSALGTRPDAVARYHRSKWAAEEIVRDSGLAFTIFRPSIIYGAGDSFVTLFARLARYSPVLPVMGSGAGKLQPIAVEAVAGCLAQAVSEPRAIGHTFDLVGPEVLTFVELLHEILRVTGCRRWIGHVPLPWARVLAATLEFGCGLAGMAPPFSRDQLIMLQEEQVGDGGPANVLFRLNPMPFRTGISRFLTKPTDRL